VRPYLAFRQRREEKWYGTAGVPGYFRKPFGGGWALVGDASYNRDPITAQGISDAFIDAEMLASALSAGLSGTGTLEDLLATHEAGRNERVRPMYEFTSQLAALEPPPPEMQALFRALYGNQDATNAFLSAITGAIPLPDFMSNDNLGRIMAATNDAEFHR
jgi:2-polyprenyl-6-methoxyphenol hydroxylase-like FAD-dependent oxidoreductase